jgi:hypothetical protein
LNLTLLIVGLTGLKVPKAECYRREKESRKGCGKHVDVRSRAKRFEER